MKKLFYLLLSGVLTASVSTACNDETIKGNGNIKSETRVAQGFDKISHGGSIDVEITQGETEFVTVVTDENLLPYIITEVEKGSLKIHVKEGANVNSTKDMIVKVSCKNLKSIASGGSGDVVSKGKIAAGDFSISQGGSGDCKLELAVQKLKVSKAGSGDFVLKGSADEVKISSAGSGDVMAKDLLSQSVDISSAGSGDFVIKKGTATKVSNVGSGEVTYQ